MGMDYTRHIMEILMKENSKKDWRVGMGNIILKMEINMLENLRMIKLMAMVSINFMMGKCIKQYIL